MTAEKMRDFLKKTQLPTIGVAFLFFLLLSSEAGAEGEVKSLNDFVYWDNGKVRQCTMYDVNGILKAKAYCRYDGTVEKVEKFDREGHKVEVALYDEKGQLRTGIDGWAATRWRYYGEWLVSQITYNESGKPIERKQFSESGKLVFRQYDEKIDDVNPYEGAMMAALLGGANIPYHESDSGNMKPVRAIGD